jgi:aminoglycoside phosphotransferase (APT) family kinase protein
MSENIPDSGRGDLNPSELSALETYMRAAGIEAIGPIRADLLSGGKSNLTFALSDGASRWTYRRPPYTGLTPSAHDVGREFHITDCLMGTSVPVPRAVLRCDDPDVLGAPFIITEFVEGRVLRTEDDLADLTDPELSACTGELLSVLVELHGVDPDGVGLGNLSRRGDYMHRQFQRWSAQWELVRNESSPDIEPLRRALAKQLPEDSASTITHGDYRIDNAIFAGDTSRILAVLDWELAALGDPLADLAMMCMYRSRPLDLILGVRAAWTSDRLPRPSELAETYARLSGRDLRNWTAYMAFANFKLAVVAQGIVHRARLDADRADEAIRVQAAVPQFIDQGMSEIS